MLTPEQKVRARKIIGMLGSDADGEILSAVRILKQSAEGRKLTITELLELVFDTPAPMEETFVPPQPSQPTPGARIHERLKTLCDLVLHYGSDIMSAWERNFYDDLTDRQQRWLSPKQREIVDRIIDKYEETVGRG